MDFTKYNPMDESKPAKEPNDRTTGQGASEPWMTSTKVILLIEYLRKHPDQGVTLYERFGSFGLKFKPGITGTDLKNGRATIAMNMFMLLQEANEDLKAMNAAGIDIPLMIHYPIGPRLTSRQASQPVNRRVLPKGEDSYGPQTPEKSLLRRK